MSDFLDEPIVAYVAITLATLLLIVEIALPTAGVAGFLALVLSVIGVWAIAEQDLVWWPLVIAAAGVATWVTLAALRRRSPGGQIVAAVLFAAGSLLFALVSEDTATLVAAIIGSAVLPIAFVPLQNAANRLMDRPSDVGMESMVGRRARVVNWEGSEGTVSLDGSLWTATGAEGVHVGDTVEVVYFEGMRLHVTPSTANTPAVPRPAPDDSAGAGA